VSHVAGECRLVAKLCRSELDVSTTGMPLTPDIRLRFDRCRSWSATLGQAGRRVLIHQHRRGRGVGRALARAARGRCPTARHPDPHRGLGEPPPVGPAPPLLRDSGPSSVCAAFRPEQWSRGPFSCSDTRIACRSALACARDCVGRAEGLPSFSARYYPRPGEVPRLPRRLDGQPARGRGQVGAHSRASLDPGAAPVPAVARTVAPGRRSQHRDSHPKARKAAETLKKSWRAREDSNP
jgi:hypothetical protein